MNDAGFLFLFIAATAICGYYLRLLTISGSIAAFAAGLIIGLGFGIRGLLVLGFFFASSSLWSKFKRRNKVKIEQKHEKGSRRDWVQVVANGGTAALFSILYLTYPQEIWFYGFAISIAAANSDTWASEIGSLSKRAPVFIRSLRAVEAGTSGAISVLGTIAALFGAFTVAILCYYLFPISIAALFIIFLFGFLGNLIDTMFGAFIQVVFQCKVCGAEVEAMSHCGKGTIYKRGLFMMNNDIVNFSSGFLASLLGVLYLL
ncbi:DUF92 domain-containing protein [Bacillus sp. DTU_2020_1000418_1_SI_GHA_SEK_038]|uniref:DUF92 domain-containing protein n=1 Tax=Bacillus sp. DTU_2020_1000418_1_SI_GHA_SEK_038 TaxID=3077585 RepID=UPI0028E40FC5|nr:DUF92 domain-containing protein [Bacillus sp. DTU_2020_1000418_1_SI_GHA_SEK_038]WNS74296.1 DUF92 domain-containing protein [Bacillus sp. DTU_2020_1000418_1_SI_GHA_SEK_038]